MKNIIKKIILVLMVVMIGGATQGQDRRTVNTKVADILAQFPAKDMTYSDRLVKEIISIGEEGIMLFSNMLVPAGTGDDTQARYAIESLATYSGAPGRENEAKMVSVALGKAIVKATNDEVKDFLIRRLQFCGGNESIELLGQFLTNDKLYGPAVATLTSIGTKQAEKQLLNQLTQVSGDKQIALIKALGVLKSEEAVPAITQLTSVPGETQKQALFALANIGNEKSVATIGKQVQVAAYLNDPSEAMVSYLHIAGQLIEKGANEAALAISNDLLKNCTKPEQLHFRSAALKNLRAIQGTKCMSVLLKEIKNPDAAYQNAVLIYASEGMTSAEVNKWVSVLKKSPVETKAQIISMLAKRTEKQVLEDAILPSLNNQSEPVRIAAIKALALNQKRNAVPQLLIQLDKASSPEEIGAIKDALLQTCPKEDCKLVAGKLEKSSDLARTILIEVLAARRATDYFGQVQALCNTDVSAFKALASLATANDIDGLFGLLKKTDNPIHIIAIQEAIKAVLQTGEAKLADQLMEKMKSENLKFKLIPLLPYTNSGNAFEAVTTIMDNGSEPEKQAAYEALLNWKNSEALPRLFSILEKGKFENTRSRTLETYLKQITASGFPDDQKLLLVRKVMPVCVSDKERATVLQAAGNIKTFLSLVFVAEYLDNEALSSVASASAMQIMLPTPGNNDGLKGNYVRAIAQKVSDKLTGPDSQYFKIDIREYLAKMPDDEGFVSIFNGKDLDGWQGLVGNPIIRAKMKPEELAKKQAEADIKAWETWSVKDGTIWFNGKGNNLCTKKQYGDFEMLVDWRITKDGDSGIYLRGTPQVQIWDIARVDVGAQVGSGGLYNNQKNPSKPPVVADNPVGEWNTFRIKMVGEKVTVYLNGILVVDNVTLENYWDRSIPIFPKEAIELQAHGTDLAFRNIFVRELNNKEAALTDQEKAEGFSLLFNGKNLDNWVGNKHDYLVEEGLIAVRPAEGGHGNLYTEKEYSSFIFRFEFKLTPGANNGLGIHAPLEGDAAYVGKELQILDNTASIYANLHEYQYHGSVYGVIPARRGYLKPVGEWNSEEVVVKGDYFKITLNGEVILEGDVKEASKNGTLDHKDHPGLLRHTGHIGFLGHGSELWFRNIRIKEL